MTARRRIAWILGITLGVLIVAAVAGGAWLLNTQEGARWGFTRLGAILPGKLDVEEMRGPLRGPLQIRKLTYRTDLAEVTIDTLDIDWRLRTLWRRRLEVRRLYASNVRWLLGKPGEQPSAKDSLASPLPDIDLPVAILIHEGSVNHLQITPSARDTGLLIDRIDLDASSLKDGLHVKRLTVHSQPIELSFDGKLVPRGSYPLALTGKWEYRPPKGPVLAGVGTVAGSLDTLRVVQDMSSPFAGHLDAFFYKPRQKNMRFLANLRFTRLEPQTLQAGWPAGSFRGWLKAGGFVNRFAAQGSIAGVSDMTGPARVDFGVRSASGTWDIDSLRMMLPRSGTVVRSRGSVHLDSLATRFRITSDWTRLVWPLQGGTPMVSSERGSARLDGTTQDYAVTLDAALAGPRMPPGHWTLDGRGGPGRLAIRTFVANLLRGQLSGSGDVAWVPQVSWRLRFQGSRIDPGAAWPAWPGNLAFGGASEGAMTPRGPEGRMLITRLAGTLRRQPLSGGGTITSHGGQFALSNAGLHWGPDQITANGGFGRQWSLQWNVNAPALAAVLPNANGSLRGQGTVRGSSGRPHVAATLRGDSLFFGRLHAGTLRVDGDVDLAPRGAVRLDVAATQVDANDQSAQRVLLTARGTGDQHQVRASVVGRVDSMVAVLDGGLRGGEWRGVVRQLQLVNHTTGIWGLEAPAPLVVAGGHVQVADLRWASGAQRIALSADWRRPGPWQLDAQLQQVQLAMVAPLLPDEMRLTGPLAGRVRAHGSATGQVWCDANLTPGPGEIAYQSASGKWVPTRFQNARVDLTADGRRLSGAVRADLVGVGTIRGDLQLPDFGVAVPPQRQALDGHLAIHLRDLALAQGLSRELDATGGRLDADLRFGGTVARPNVRGPLQIRDGVASLPRLGVDLKEIQVRASSGAAGQLALQGSLRSGPGVLQFGGTAALGTGAQPEAKVSAKGDRIEAMHTREMSFLVSPDLQMALHGRRVDLTGQVTIPEGTIEVEKDEKRTVVKPSTDVVYWGADTLHGAPIEMHSQVRLVVGDKVTFRGYGLEMRPAGSVLVNDEPGLPPLGTGEFTVKDGKYKIYGQELAIDQARLIFGGGPLINPAIRARASRKAGSVTAGFDVSGTVQKPDVRIFSDPPMGESQALSYVMFGKPMERSNLSQGQLLSTMATNLGVRGSNIAAHGVASGVGIQDAKVEAGDAFRNASLSLGTHLSPKLYVSYGVGLFETVTALRLRYLVSSAWTIEAESAQQNRVDVLYTVEK